MGNQIGVSKDPPQVAELSKLDSVSFTNTDTPNGEFSSFLQIWRFYCDLADGHCVKDEAVQFSDFKRFDGNDCYVAISITKHPREQNGPQNTRSDSEHSTHQPSMTDLLTSSLDELTPRGLSSSFGTITFEPFIRNTQEECTHDLYVWNGKQSSPLARAVALAKGFEIERVLDKERLTKVLLRRFECGPAVALSSLLVDDVVNRTSYTPAIKQFENVHLLRQLLAEPFPKPSVKIGDLFGSSDNPRYNLIQKLVTPQITPQSGEKPAMKLPSLNLKPLSLPVTSKPTIKSISVPSLPTKPVTQLKLPMNISRSTSATLPSTTSPSSSNSPAPAPTTPNYASMPATDVLRLFEPVLSKITDHLYLGSRYPAKNKKELSEAGVTHILNCAGLACNNEFPNDIVYKTYNIADSSAEDISSLFYDSIEFMEGAMSKGESVLVHCHQGVSRSSAFILCYLMWKNDWTFQQAHDFVRDIRYIANPNGGFVGQLITWKKVLKTGAHTTRLLRISQVRPSTLIAKNVSEIKATSLDSRGVFIVYNPSDFYIWKGSQSQPEHFTAAKRSVSLFQKFEKASSVVVEVEEGHETPSFWESIGGQDAPTRHLEYDKDYDLEIIRRDTEVENENRAAIIAKHNHQQEADKPPPKKVATYYKPDDDGKWQQQEDPFDMEELDSEGLYVVVSDGTIFVWVGEDFCDAQGQNREDAGLRLGKELSQHKHLGDHKIEVITDQDDETEEFLSLLV